MKIAITIVQLICALALILIVLFQTGKSSGLGAVSGNSEAMGFKAKSKTWDAKLAKYTKWIGLAFVLLTFILNLL